MPRDCNCKICDSCDPCQKKKKDKDCCPKEICKRLDRLEKCLKCDKKCILKKNTEIKGALTVGFIEIPANGNNTIQIPDAVSTVELVPPGEIIIIAPFCIVLPGDACAGQLLFIRNDSGNSGNLLSTQVADEEGIVLFYNGMSWLIVART